MAGVQKKNIVLKQWKSNQIIGNSIANGKSLEIGEGYAKNIFPVQKTYQHRKQNPFF